MHPLPEGGLVARAREGDRWRLYVLEPGFATPGLGVDLAVPTSLSACSPDGRAWEGILHALCGGPLQVARYSLLTGAEAAPRRTVTQEDAFNTGALDAEVAVGADGTLWVLKRNDCEYGRCPVLFRAAGRGDFGEPVFAAYAQGDVRVAVDPAGRPHLFWATQTESGATLWHTVQEGGTP